ncbi:MAG TPA: PAS domain-containing protein, partial [Armatimonadota bacterium]|nr:PAS domain-containing protein [Armatimonadota bacterium]
MRDDGESRVRRAFRLMRRAQGSTVEPSQASESAADVPTTGTEDLREAHQALLLEIEERKRCEAELAQERELTRALIHSSPAGVLLMDRQGQVRDCNERCAELLHVPRAAIV